MAIQYERAPITEALIDLRVENSSSVKLASLESLYSLISESYPVKRTRGVVVGQISAGDAVGASASQTQTGFSFSSRDSLQIFQARTDGFTFSRLRPYVNWASLRDEAWKLWDIYRSVVKPVKISRIALRYINQIDIPLPTVDYTLDYKDYFRTTPDVSPVLPQELAGFFMELHFPQADFQGTLILRQAAVPAPGPEMHSVVLDLDVFKESSEGIQEEIAWALLETLRQRKNEFFEGSLTDKARKLFGEKEEY